MPPYGPTFYIGGHQQPPQQYSMAPSITQSQINQISQDFSQAKSCLNPVFNAQPRFNRPRNDPKPGGFMNRTKTFNVLPVENANATKISQSSQSAPSFQPPPHFDPTSPSLLMNPLIPTSPYTVMSGPQFMGSFPMGPYPPPLLHPHQFFPPYQIVPPHYRPPQQHQQPHIPRSAPVSSAPRPPVKSKSAPKKNTQPKPGETSLTAQVYDLKPNLTKKALHDILTPLVASIDFKTKTNEPASTDEVNEDKEDVFVRFESVDKLNEAFRMFNLNGNQVDPPPFSLRPIIT